MTAPVAAGRPDDPGQAAARAGARRGGWLRPVLAVASVVFAILPMLLVRHLPLIDFPNHLARFEIRNFLLAGSELSRFYEWRWAFMPTLGLDLAVIPLNQVMPVETAGNLALTLALVTMCLGAMAVDRTLNGARWGLSLFTGIILYNGAFRFGFASFIIGTSLALPLFAAWVWRRPRWGAADVVAFTLAGVALLTVHLYGFGLYAVCVAGYEAVLLWDDARPAGGWRWPRLAPAISVVATLLLPLLTLLASPTAEQADVTRWSTLTWKIEALVSPIFFNQPHIELPLLAVFAGTLGLGLATGVLRLHRHMVPAMLAFAVLALALPRTLFGSNYADYRMLAGAGFFFLASLRLETAVPLRRRIVLAILTLCLVVRVGSVAADWMSVQPVLAEYRDALSPLPPGAKLLVIRGELPSRSQRRTPPLEHVPVLAAARQQAFTGYIFDEKVTPLRIRPAYAGLIHGAPDPELAATMGQYDYLLAVQNPDITIPPGLRLEPVKRGQTYVLSRIVRD